MSEILYQLRTRKKLSQENIADALGVDYTTYARYESGKTEIKASQAKRLAQFYGLTIEQFFNFELYDVMKKPSKLNEGYEKYLKRSKETVSLIVELDGTKNSEKKWINMIQAINAMIRDQKEPKE